MRYFLLFISLFILQSSTLIKSTAKDSVCINAEEKKLYDLIMEYRESKGLAPIPLSSQLTKVAQAHTQDLATNYEFDVKNKCNPHSWSKKGKWTACCYTSDHKQAKCMWDKPKEIAGYESPGYEIAYYSSAGANAQEGLDGWKVSPGHNPLIVNEGMWSKAHWKGIGIGIYKEYAVVWFGEVEDNSSIDVCED